MEKAGRNLSGLADLDPVFKTIIGTCIVIALKMITRSTHRRILSPSGRRSSLEYRTRD